jgi:hypothetical protein
MATSQKTFSGDYQVNLGPFTGSVPGNIGVGTGYLIVNGNLLVQGTAIASNTTILETTAPFILAGEENPGPGNPLGYGNLGLVVQTGGGNVLPTYAAIQVNGNANAWQISSNTTSGNSGAVGSYANILVEGGTVPATPAGSNTQIQFNSANLLGASAALVFDYGANALGISGQINLAHLAGTPGNVASNTVVYANTAGSGGTGIYFVDADNTQDELVSKSKAIVFGIIF